MPDAPSHSGGNFVSPEAPIPAANPIWICQRIKKEDIDLIIILLPRSHETKLAQPPQQMKHLTLILVAASFFAHEMQAQVTFGGCRPAPTVWFQTARPAVCWNANRWNSPGWVWSSGWNNFGWGSGGVFITYENPRPGISSGFGTLRVPETRIHRVPPPVEITKPLVIHEGTSFRWKK